jgi:hypothetical protein
VRHTRAIYEPLNYIIMKKRKVQKLSVSKTTITHLLPLQQACIAGGASGVCYVPNATDPTLERTCFCTGSLHVCCA